MNAFHSKYTWIDLANETQFERQADIAAPYRSVGFAAKLRFSIG